MRNKFTKLLFLAACVFAPSCDGLHDELGPRARTEIPFRAGVKGAVAEDDFHVPADFYYTAYLSFHWKPGDLDSLKRAEALAGGPGTDKNGFLSPPGVYAPVHLTITKTSGHTPVIIVDSDFIGNNMNETGISRVLASFRLDHGDYRVRAEALADAKELDGVETTLDLHVPHGK